jgi:hypothetical protein
VKNTHSNTLKDFFSFIKKPTFDSFEDLSLGKKILVLIKIYFLTIVLLIITDRIIRVLIELGIFGKYAQIIHTPDSSDKELTRLYLFVLFLIIPVLEEFSFRLLLIKYNKKFIIYSTSLIIGFYIYQFSSSYLFFPANKILLCFTPYLYIILFSAIIIKIILFISNKVTIINPEAVWNNKFHLIFYLVAILFSLHHISGLNINSSHYLFLPIILLPFFIYAVILGYIRIRLGLFYSIMLHLLLILPKIVNSISNL